MIETPYGQVQQLPLRLRVYRRDVADDYPVPAHIELSGLETVS